MNGSHVSWVRREARAFRASLGSEVSGLAPADTVLRVALRHLRLSALRLPSDDPLLAGSYAVLDRDASCVWFRNDLPESTAHALLGHEIGHCVCHACPDRVEDGIGAACGGLSEAEPLIAVDGYGPAQRAELEASVFGLELLLPGDVGAEAFRAGRSATEIAAQVGLAERDVLRQLAAEILEPRAAERESSADERMRSLDGEQLGAARATQLPALVVAGPGSGKTRTLIGRVEWLCSTRVAPEHILVLTYSRNAADDLRERIRSVMGPAGSRVPVHTVHGFGLELLRRFGSTLGLPASPGIVDRVSALDVLETVLPALAEELDLGNDDPGSALPRLAEAVARVREHGSGIDGTSETDTHREYSRLADRYEAELRRRGCVDYADMVALPVRVLNEHPRVRAMVHQEVRHVLVDEWQDLSPACVEFVVAIAQGGSRLWAVGDMQQSIYGFRGAGVARAGPRNGLDWVQYALRTNYRGSRLLVELLNRYARSQGIGPGDAFALANAEGGSASVVVAEDEAALADGLVAQIRGVWTRDARHSQAVLCRTNAQAARVASLLASRGVSAVGSPSALDCADVRCALQAMSAPRPDDQGDGCEPATDALMCVGRLLFGREAIVRDAMSASGPDALPRLRSLAWLLHTAEGSVHRWRQDTVRAATDPLASFLSDVRSAVALAEDRVRPSAADHLPPFVPAMTIHGSKGLEFDHVTIPFLNHGFFPPHHRPSVTSVSEDSDGGDEDEARLLFVGMSRARLGLTLSRCRRLSGRAARPSALFEDVAEAVARAGGSSAEWSPSAGCAEAVVGAHGRSVHRRDATITLADVESYRRCPRRWAYDAACSRSDRSLGLWVAHQSALRHAGRLILSCAPRTRADCVEPALAEWSARTGLTDVSTGSAGLLRRQAEAVISRMCADAQLYGGEFGRDLPFTVAGRTMTVKADRLEVLPDGVVLLERFIPRSRYATDARRLDLAALHWAGEMISPGLSPQVAIRYLASGECARYAATGSLLRGSARRIEGAIAGIERGLRPTKASDLCNRCPYLFACARSADVGDDDDGGTPQ